MPIAIFGGLSEPITVNSEGPLLSSFICIAGEANGPQTSTTIFIAGESALVCLNTEIDDNRVLETSVFIDSNNSLILKAESINFYGNDTTRRLLTLATVGRNGISNNYIDINGSQYDRTLFPIDSQQRTYHNNVQPSFYRYLIVVNTPNGRVITIDKLLCDVTVQNQNGTNYSIFKYSLSHGTFISAAASNTALWILFDTEEDLNGEDRYNLKAFNLQTGVLIDIQRISNFIPLTIDLKHLSHLQLKPIVYKWHFLKMSGNIVLADFIKTTCKFTDDREIATTVIIDDLYALQSTVEFWTGQWRSGSYRRKVNITWTAKHTLSHTNILIDVTSWGTNWWDKLNNAEDFSVYINNMGLLPSILVGNIETETGYIVIRLDTIEKGQSYDLDFYVYWNNISGSDSIHPNLYGISSVIRSHSIYGESPSFSLKSTSGGDPLFETDEHIEDWIHAVRLITDVDCDIQQSYSDLKSYTDYIGEYNTLVQRIYVWTDSQIEHYLRIEFYLAGANQYGILKYIREEAGQIDLFNNFYTLLSVCYGVESRCWTSCVNSGDNLVSPDTNYVPEDTPANPALLVYDIDSDLNTNDPKLDSLACLISPANPTFNLFSIDESFVAINSEVYLYDENTIRSNVTLVWELKSEGPRLDIFLRRHDSVTLVSPELFACSAVNLSVETKKIGNDLLHLVCTETKVIIIAETDKVDNFGDYYRKHPSETDPFLKRCYRSHIYFVDSITKWFSIPPIYIPNRVSKQVDASDTMKLVFLSIDYNNDTTHMDIDVVVFDFDGTILYDEDNVIEYESYSGQPLSHTVFQYNVLLAASNFGFIIFYKLYSYGSGTLIRHYPYYILYDTSYNKIINNFFQPTYNYYIGGLGFIDLVDAISLKVNLGQSDFKQGVKTTTNLYASLISGISTSSNIDIDSCIKTGIDLFTDLGINLKITLTDLPYREINYILPIGPLDSTMRLSHSINTNRQSVWVGPCNSPFTTYLEEGAYISEDKYLFNIVNKRPGWWYFSEERSFLTKLNLETNKLECTYENTFIVRNNEIYGYRLENISFSKSLQWCFVTRHCFKREIPNPTYPQTWDYEFQYIDILILNSNLEPITTIKQFKNTDILDTAISLHEKDGIFYLLTRNISPVQKSSYYPLLDSDKLNIYTSTDIFSDWTLLYSLNWNSFYSVNDDEYTFLNIIQITNHHIWISGGVTVEKVNIGLANNVGIRLDGSGHDIINGLFGFVYDIYEENKYSLVVIKRTHSENKLTTAAQIAAIEILNDETLDPICTPNFQNNAFWYSFISKFECKFTLSYKKQVYDWVKLSTTLTDNTSIALQENRSIYYIDNNNEMIYNG